MANKQISKKGSAEIMIRLHLFAFWVLLTYDPGLPLIMNKRCAPFRDFLYSLISRRIQYAYTYVCGEDKGGIKNLTFTPHT